MSDTNYEPGDDGQLQKARSRRNLRQLLDLAEIQIQRAESRANDAELELTKIRSAVERVHELATNLLAAAKAEGERWDQPGLTNIVAVTTAHVRPTTDSADDAATDPPATPQAEGTDR